MEKPGEDFFVLFINIVHWGMGWPSGRLETQEDPCQGNLFMILFTTLTGKPLFQVVTFVSCTTAA